MSEGSDLASKNNMNTSVENRKLISQIREEQLGHGDKVTFFFIFNDLL